MEDEWSNLNITDEDSDSSDSDETEPPKTGKHDEEYFMLHPRRGKALIFNFMEFDNRKHDTRVGSSKDAESLYLTFSDLGFEVKTYTNLTADALKKALKVVSMQDHSDADCICVSVMTHGHRHGRLAARDCTFEVSDLWQPFTADKCKSLAGKPKLFFVQACRGDKLDTGSYVEKSIIQLKTKYKIPIFSDILLAYSSFDGYSSIRDIEKGTWFMQSLCDELQRHGEKHHLLTILTFVCKRVAIDFQTRAGEKQMPTIVSMLTRLLYFRPLEEENA